MLVFLGTMKPHLILGLILVLVTSGLTSEVTDDVTEALESLLEYEDYDIDASDSALLRNFFTVNLTPQKRNQRKRPKLKFASSRTQKKRLEGLFLALSDPIGCKLFFHSVEI